MILKSYLEGLPNRLQISILAALVAITYYLSAQFGLSLSFKPDYIAALWPPNAILLSALLLTKTKNWVWFLFAIVPAELAADLPAGIPVNMSIGFIFADWIEVLTAALLFRKFSATLPDFSSMKQTILYIICCVVIAPFVAAFPGALITGISQSGPDYLTRWARWFTSDGLTHLLITPFIVLWLCRIHSQATSRSVAYYFELFVLSATLFIAGTISLSGTMLSIETFPALLYAPLPILLWAAVRFGPRGIFSFSLFIAVVCIWSASNGSGPFTGRSPEENVINLQLYLIITLTPLIFLATLIEDQKNAENVLKKSEEQYRSLFENNISIILLVDPDTGSIFGANQSACLYYGYSREELRKMKITDINSLSEKELSQEMEKAKTEKRNYFNFCHRLSNGEIRDVEVYSGPITLRNKSLLCSTVHDISERKSAEREREQLIDKLQNALKEIKTLRGILPICSLCKNIRDDKGYWNHVESYISAHSDAEFSHGMCPECSDKLYGDEDWYKKGKLEHKE